MRLLGPIGRVHQTAAPLHCRQSHIAEFTHIVAQPFPKTSLPMRSQLLQIIKRERRPVVWFIVILVIIIIILLLIVPIDVNLTSMST